MKMNSKPICLNDFQEYAKKHLSKSTYDYVTIGAGDEVTLQDNFHAFNRWRIRPRVLRDVSKIDLKTKILSHEIAFPVCISPTAVHGLVNPSAEPATAKGAQNAGIGFTLSIHSTKSIEDVAEGVPHALRFLQIYSASDMNITLQHMRRAERSGYTALVLTVDAPIFCKRVGDERNQFWTQPLVNFTYGNMVPTQTEKEHGLTSNAKLDHAINFDRLTTPETLKWLMKESRLPVIIKGILTGEDAKVAVDCGVSGILVSNHGGRLLDTVLSTIDALPEVVAAVNGRCDVFLDGGVRNGTDIFKALALGAKAVFIGRPAVYALAYNGMAGVTDMLTILKEEFQTTMALAGCSSVSEIKREMVVHDSVYKSHL